MTATFILTSTPPKFPVGTTVKAYVGYDTAQKTEEPRGSVQASAVVASNGSVTFTGLEYGTDYWAAAPVGGLWQWTKFRTVPAPAYVGLGGADVDVGALVDQVNALADGASVTSAELASILAGTTFFDAVNAAKAGGAQVALQDTTGPANQRTFRALIAGSTVKFQKLNDLLGATDLVTFDLAANTVTIPAGKLSADPEAWHVVGSGGSEPAFINSWSSGPTSPGFYRHLGRVHLKGWLSHGAASIQNAFALPAGYRPAEGRTLVGVNQSNAIVPVYVDTDGSVHPLVAQTFVCLDGMTFRAEA